MSAYCVMTRPKWRSWRPRYGETDFHSLIEGDNGYTAEGNLGEHGYTEQEFQDEELVDVEEEPDEDDFEMNSKNLMIRI